MASGSYYQLKVEQYMHETVADFVKVKQTLFKNF